MLAAITVVLSAFAAPVKLVDVMVPGASSTDCSEPPCVYKAFRIPGFANAGNGTLLAFAEGRKFGCGDFGPPPPPGKKATGGQHDMVVARSTDSGKTWGKISTMIDALAFPPWKHLHANVKPENGNAVWDPTPLYDAVKGTVWLFFNGPGREPVDKAMISQTWASKSTDKGITWTTANVTSSCQRPGPFNGRAANTPGNGHGVQLASGRLVVPMYGGTPAGGSICYSDDHGATWKAEAQAAKISGVGVTEIEVAELNGQPDNLYMTIRNDKPVDEEGNRQYSLSTDAGVTWGERLNVQVPDPNCKGGVVQDKANKLLVLATAASCAGRANQTVFLSKENGKPGSWLYRQFIYPATGYSTLQMTDDGMVANLFEKAGCGLTLALIDPKAMLADGPQPPISCASSQCPGKKRVAKPPPPPYATDPKVGFCVGPPPPPPPPKPLPAACQAKLDAFCNDKVKNKPCVESTVKSYPTAAPFYARFDLGCALEPKKPWPHGVPQGPCVKAGMTKCWRCYSHLALSQNLKWSNKVEHPNAYCSEPGQLAHMIATCKKTL